MCTPSPSSSASTSMGRPSTCLSAASSPAMRALSSAAVGRDAGLCSQHADMTSYTGPGHSTGCFSRFLDMIARTTSGFPRSPHGCDAFEKSSIADQCVQCCATSDYIPHISTPNIQMSDFSENTPSMIDSGAIHLMGINAEPDLR